MCASASAVSIGNESSDHARNSSANFITPPPPHSAQVLVTGSGEQHDNHDLQRDNSRKAAPANYPVGSRRRKNDNLNNNSKKCAMN